MARRRPELPGQERHRAGPPAPPNPPAPCRPTHPRACCAASPPARLPALTGQWVSRRADAETCLQAGRPLTEGGRPRLPARVKGSSPHRQLPVPPKEARPAPCAAHSLRVLCAHHCPAQLLRARTPVGSDIVSVTPVPEACNTHQRGAFCPQAQYRAWSGGVRCVPEFSIHLTRRRRTSTTRHCPWNTCPAVIFT